MGTVYLNGKYLPIEDATVSVLDRGFIYGDGVYELIPVYRRQPYRMVEHLQRLQHSLDRIKLANPHTGAEWKAIVEGTIERQTFEDQGVYFQVTRGVAKRDHTFPKDTPATVFMMSNPLATPSAETIANGVACVTAIDERWLNCDIKSISLLGNVLMRQFAADRDAVETVMFRQGYLTEASASNILIVRDGVIAAPPKDNMILPGITYGALYDLARQGGLPFEIRPITAAEVWTADELWVSSSTKEVLAIVTLDGHPVGNALHRGKPGPIFRKMHALFQASKLVV
ncbi:MAG: D-amino acid aminotransferase [Casimicrobiaceae bacterium]